MEQCQNFFAVRHISASQFTDDKWVTNHGTGVQHGHKLCLGFAEMIDPQVRINKRHLLDLLRGGIRSAFSEPPNFASRLALSRAISASSPNLTS
jgi:hypothetical protein